MVQYSSSTSREKIGEYFTILIEFHETNDYTNIKKWIYDNCIDGVE